MTRVGIPLYVETWDDFRGKAYAMRDDSLDDHSSSSYLDSSSSSANYGSRRRPSSNVMSDGSGSSLNSKYNSRRSISDSSPTSVLDITSSRHRKGSSISSSSSVCSSSSKSSQKRPSTKRSNLKNLLGGEKKQKPIFPKNGPRMGKIKNGKFIPAERTEDEK